MYRQKKRRIRAAQRPLGPSKPGGCDKSNVGHYEDEASYPVFVFLDAVVIYQGSPNDSAIESAYQQHRNNCTGYEDMMGEDFT